MIRRFRPRKEFKFWLYHDLADDVRLMEYIAYLRTTRQFAKALRNGLRLIWTLGEADTSFLFQLFPQLEATLRKKFSDDDMKGQIKRLQSMIEEYRREVTIDGGPLVAQPALKQPGGFKALPMLIEDDDDGEETIILNRSTSTNGTSNFLNSLASFE